MGHASDAHLLARSVESFSSLCMADFQRITEYFVGNCAESSIVSAVFYSGFSLGARIGTIANLSGCSDREERWSQMNRGFALPMDVEVGYDTSSKISAREPQPNSDSSTATNRILWSRWISKTMADCSFA